MGLNNPLKQGVSLLSITEVLGNVKFGILPFGSLTEYFNLNSKGLLPEIKLKSQRGLEELFTQHYSGAIFCISGDSHRA